MQTQIFDIIIIGAGPIGIACGIEAKKNKLSYLIIEKGCLVNSLYNYPVNMTFFSTSEKLEIGDIPFATTNPKPKRAEALEYYRRVHDNFNINSRLFEEVIAIKKDKNIFNVNTTKSQYFAKNIIVATGFYDNPILLNVPGENLQKVNHYYKDPHYYANQNVAVIGASNSSIDAALETYRKGANVTLIIRGDEISPRVKYWVKPDIENRITAGEIKAFFKSNIIEIQNDSIMIETPKGIINIPNDFVLALTGYKPNFKLLTKFGIQLDEQNEMIPNHNPLTMETNIKNLYLAGVVCGGLNTHQWFIENSRVHAEIIIKNIGKDLRS